MELIEAERLAVQELAVKSVTSCATPSVRVSVIEGVVALKIIEWVPTFTTRLAFVGELKQLDVSAVAATDVATEAQNAWREDESVAGLERDVALKNAPLARHNQFVVPKVVE